MKINVRLEGGVGDCILGCRFLPAIIDFNKQKDSTYVELNAYIDSEGNPLQKQVIDYIYPEVFANTITIPRKKYSKMVIESQWGKEEMKGFIENVPDDYFKQMMDCDVFYDLHIDSLKFMDYDFDWSKNFQKLLKPAHSNDVFVGRYICSHLVSSSSPVHRMESWYVEKVVSLLDELAKRLKWQHIIISTPEVNKFYDAAMKGCEKTHIFNGSPTEACDFANGASAFIGVDSAWRLLGYANEIPTITFSKDCKGWGGVPFSHRLRWLCWPETTFQIHHDANVVVGLLEKMIQSPVHRLIPYLGAAENLDNAIIKRNYKIIEEECLKITTL